MMKKLGCFVFAALFAYVTTQIYQAISGNLFWKFWIDQFYYGSENDGMLVVFLLFCAVFSIPLFFGVIKGAWCEFREPSQMPNRSFGEPGKRSEHQDWLIAHGVTDVNVQIFGGSDTWWTDKKGKTHCTTEWVMDEGSGTVERDYMFDDKTGHWDWTDGNYQWVEENHE